MSNLFEIKTRKQKLLFEEIKESSNTMFNEVIELVKSEQESINLNITTIINLINEQTDDDDEKIRQQILDLFLEFGINMDKINMNLHDIGNKIIESTGYGKLVINEGTSEESSNISPARRRSRRPGVHGMGGGGVAINIDENQNIILGMQLKAYVWHLKRVKLQTVWTMIFSIILEQ